MDASLFFLKAKKRIRLMNGVLIALNEAWNPGLVPALSGHMIAAQLHTYSSTLYRYD
jgi:hypothetical protein